MENKELKWIAEVIEKLQVLQTYNEGERLTKILKKVAPALIAALDYAALSKFSIHDPDSEDKNSMIYAGHTCNACGHDYFIEENNAKHSRICVGRDGKGGLDCRYEKLLTLLKEIETEQE